MHLMIRAFVVASLATFALALPVSAQQLDVIRGQVLGPDGKPLEDAKVTATSLSGNVNRSARILYGFDWRLMHPERQ